MGMFTGKPTLEKLRQREAQAHENLRRAQATLAKKKNREWWYGKEAVREARDHVADCKEVLAGAKADVERAQMGQGR